MSKSLDHLITSVRSSLRTTCKYLKNISEKRRNLYNKLYGGIEKEINLSTSSIDLSDSVLIHPTLMSLHNDGPLLSDWNNPQYKIIKYYGITFQAGTLANGCCLWFKLWCYCMY